jgi:hypothetical protein
MWQDSPSIVTPGDHAGRIHGLMFDIDGRLGFDVHRASQPPLSAASSSIGLSASHIPGHRLLILARGDGLSNCLFGSGLGGRRWVCILPFEFDRQRQLSIPCDHLQRPAKGAIQQCACSRNFGSWIAQSLCERLNSRGRMLACQRLDIGHYARTTARIGRPTALEPVRIAGSALRHGIDPLSSQFQPRRSSSGLRRTLAVPIGFFTSASVSSRGPKVALTGTARPLPSAHYHLSASRLGRLDD